MTMLVVENLVVDASGFVKCLSIQQFGGNVFTVDEVVSEIRDKTTRERLALVPFEIKFRQPSQKSLQFVSSFSKQTGDFGTLSTVDLKLLALTYELEGEVKGTTDHLRIRPLHKSCVVYGGGSKGSLSVAGVASEEGVGGDRSQLGFYSPGSSVHGNEENDDDACDESDGGGWITPDNIATHSAQEDGDAAPIPVACLTTDYAMQNVLIQVGLGVVSVDGALITSTRTFILRCYQCFRLCSDPGEVWCPGCGHRTLKRVSVRVGADGRLTYSINANHRINTRHMNAPLPAPRGGKHALPAMVRPDQKMAQQRASRKSMQRTDALNPDYYVNEGVSPFVERDVTSRAFSAGHTRPGQRGRRGNRKHR